MELWDAYDEYENKLNIKLLRGEEIPDGVFHLVSETVVRHEDGSFLLMQRDFTKKIYPGYWEVGASGSALQNETGKESAIRELFEETGIVGKSMQEIFHFISRKEKSIYYGFFTIADQSKDSILLQKGETIAYKWISKDECISFLKGNDCIPNQRERLLSLFEDLYVFE